MKIRCTAPYRRAAWNIFIPAGPSVFRSSAGCSVCRKLEEWRWMAGRNAAPEVAEPGHGPRVECRFDPLRLCSQLNSSAARSAATRGCGRRRP